MKAQKYFPLSFALKNIFVLSLRNVDVGRTQAELLVKLKARPLTDYTEHTYRHLTIHDLSKEYLFKIIFKRPEKNIYNHVIYVFLDIDCTLGVPIRDFLGVDLGAYDLFDDMIAMDTSKLICNFHLT